MCISIFIVLERNYTVSLEDVLQFLTGSRLIPAVGFETNLSISFTDVEQLPTVSICTSCLTLPRSYADLYLKKFAEKMDSCILESFGFGNA